MYPLIESIKVEHCNLCSLNYHEERMNRSLMYLYGVKQHPVNFHLIAEKTAELDPGQVFKLRVKYGESAYKFNIEPYHIKPVSSIIVLDDCGIDYEFKYADRLSLDNLYKRRKEFDDILICRNGTITDTYYCNVAFEKGGVWYTPDIPLLKGTKRAQLIDKGLIKEEELYVEDIPDMSRIRLFNSMIEFGDIDLAISGIHIS